MAYIGETGRKLTDQFCEYLKDIHNVAAKPISLNSP